MKRNAIELAIRHTASTKLNGKYNLCQYRKEGTPQYEERKKAMLHKSVCEQIVSFLDRHVDIPLYFILSVGVSKGAYKMSEFNKGYKSFDAEKVEAIAVMGALYNKYNGIGGRKMSDVTIRLIMRYYEKKSKDMGQFVADLQNSSVMGKECAKRGHYEELCKNLNIPIKEKKDALLDVA